LSGPERVLDIVRDVVLPIDVRTRYDVYFSNWRVGIVCLGRAERVESETDGPLSLMSSVFGVPPPISPQAGKAQPKPTIDDEIKGTSLDYLLKLSKKSCYYTLEEIERVELVWGNKPKFIILSKDCESKFFPDPEQLEQLIETILKVEGLKDKLWIAGKYSVLFDESQVATVCKFCGAYNDSDAVYCQSCGKKLEEEPVNVTPSELTCSQCGTKNRSQAQFCKQCGVLLC